METRKELEERLLLAGVPGRALEALLKETGLARHKWRVTQAIDAALAATDGCRTAAAWVLLSDMYGVGGKGGVSGDGTSRHPALERLGKGRKQATDGEAWSAAIEAAFHALALNGVTLDASGTLGNGFVARLNYVDEPPEVVPPTSWAAQTAAHEGLRRAIGLDGWFNLPVQYTGTAAEWAAVVNYEEDDEEGAE